MVNHYQVAATVVRNLIQEDAPRTAIVLGSGLGNLLSDMEVIAEIPYAEIPHFPVSTVEGHAGRLVVGVLAGVKVLVMKGRFHYYEGYGMSEVTLPIRVMQLLGVKNIILSNAAGGLNPAFCNGDVMLITDHINHFPENPLRGKNDETLGVRFPDMSNAYDRDFRASILNIAEQHNIPLRTGVYLGTAGPSFETPAECRFFLKIGADAVGMSTVPEVIVAIHGGLRLAAFSVITNTINPDFPSVTTHEEVQAMAKIAEPSLKTLLKAFIQTL